MRFTLPNNVLILIVLLSLASGSAVGQNAGTAKEVWPAVKVNFELQQRLNLQVFVEAENGEEFPFVQWKTGALISYRMKRILKPREDEIDNENKYNLAVAVGYEYLKTTQNGTLGYEVTYIRQFSMPDGSTKYRLVTNRPILLAKPGRIAGRWTTTCLVWKSF